MNKANQIQKNIRPRQVTLYRNVFCSRVSTAVVLCLCLSFLLQPMSRLYASQTDFAELAVPEIINLAVDANLTNTTTDTTESVTIPSVSTTDPTSTTSTSLATSDNASTTVTTTIFSDQEIQDLINDEDEIAAYDIAEASTTTASSTEIPVAISTVYSDQVVQFDKSDCVTVEDGSFYCQVKKDATDTTTDGLYSLQDIDGDLEIFLQKNAELTQLTFNTVDDAAPYFDSKSNTIVWHRQINERYQIISFDLTSNTEVQLTADTVNNMEPSRAGDFTVWQRWNNNNWDVVLYDGVETMYLTQSEQHDIAPKIKGDLVMWNRLNSDNTQTIELYDIVTKELTTISDTEGGALSNPRMVLVYETEFANGDIITKGYDVDTGEITSLASKAADLPEDLPEPDSTGETRALLQGKNPTKEDTDIAENILPPKEPVGSNPPSPQPNDLVIASSSNATAGSTVVASSTSGSLHELTLDLNPPVIMTEDTGTLSIPPYVAPASEAVSI